MAHIESFTRMLSFIWCTRVHTLCIIHTRSHTLPHTHTLTHSAPYTHVHTRRPHPPQARLKPQCLDVPLSRTRTLKQDQNAEPEFLHAGCSRTHGERVSCNFSKSLCVEGTRVIEMIVHHSVCSFFFFFCFLQSWRWWLVCVCVWGYSLGSGGWCVCVCVCVCVWGRVVLG